MKMNIALVATVFLIAFCLGFYDVSYPPFKWQDEPLHVQAAMNYWTNGQFEPDIWEHPPLRHILLNGFLEVFGDTPYGWRMRNVLAGAIAAALTFIFALEISGRKKTALLAGVLIATDPLHLVLSRFTFDEIYGGVFLLAAIIFYLKHRQQCALLMLSAFFIGCAVAVKWYYVPGWAILASLALYENRKSRNIGAILFIASAYILIPLSVYLCSYYPWFSRGYTLSELMELVANAYFSLQKLQAAAYDSGLFFLKHTSAAKWFTSSIIVGQGTYSNVGIGRGEFILFTNNLPIWILTIPSMIGITFLSIKEKTFRYLIPVLFFCATYALFFFVKRPAFIYSAVPLIPFAFTATAICITRLTEHFSPKTYYAILAVILTWNFYLYPLVTAKKVPVTPYRLILEHADIKLIK